MGKVESCNNREIPWWKKSVISIGFIGLINILSGCEGVTFGYVTATGPKFIGTAPTAWHIKHEKCHMEKLLETGEEEYYDEYWGNLQFAIEEERRCGFPNPEQHAAIKYRVKTTSPPSQQNTIVFVVPN